ALLTMFEHERKSGRLVLFGAQTAWIDVIDGRIVGAGASGLTALPRAVMLSLLDWTHGSFELLVAVPDYADDGVCYPITHLLLEHARIRDEAQRRADQILPRIQERRDLAFS
ncbi:MAG: DUF4388 domain-containing protein, partial [Polyangiales bacterium]